MCRGATGQISNLKNLRKGLFALIGFVDKDPVRLNVVLDLPVCLCVIGNNIKKLCMIKT